MCQTTTTLGTEGLGERYTCTCAHGRRGAWTADNVGRIRHYAGRQEQSHEAFIDAPTLEAVTASISCPTVSSAFHNLMRGLAMEGLEGPSGAPRSLFEPPAAEPAHQQQQRAAQPAHGRQPLGIVTGKGVQINATQDPAPPSLTTPPPTPSHPKPTSGLQYFSVASSVGPMPCSIMGRGQ